MEFGETLPLSILALCCFGLTPIIGFSALAYIRFSLKDISLARNIFVTLIATAILPFLYMGYGVVSVIIILPRGLITLNLSEILSAYLSEFLRMEFLSLTLSFLIAFILIVPITFLMRHVNKNQTNS
jgi:hypothetical protein